MELVPGASGLALTGGRLRQLWPLQSEGRPLWSRPPDLPARDGSDARDPTIARRTGIRQTDSKLGHLDVRKSCTALSSKTHSGMMRRLSSLVKTRQTQIPSPRESWAETTAP